MRAGRRVHWQRQVGKDLTEEKPGAVAAVDQATVFADPAEPGITRQCAFQHRRRVDKHAIAEAADCRADAVGQLLQPASHQLVVVAAEGRSEEHTSELQSLMRISYAVFCLKKKKK